MRIWFERALRLVVVAAALVVAPPAQASVHTHVEDFATRQYIDTLVTTAWWDTTTGSLKPYPFYPALVGSYDTPDRANKVAVAGNYAFVASHDNGFHVLDISDPANPTLVGSYDTPAYAYDVVVAGNRAYVADGNPSGLQVLDVTDVTNPTLVGSYDTPSHARGIAICGNRAYVADMWGGLQIINVSDTIPPTLLGSYSTSGLAYDVAVSGVYAYVADGTDGLKVIDVADPTGPTLAGSAALGGIAFGVVVSGDHAFLACGAAGMVAVDISDPTNPSVLGTYDTPGTAYGLDVSGDYAYVADDATLEVIDIGDPGNPAWLHGYDTSDHANGVAVAADLAFVACGIAGIEVLAIARPTPSTLAGRTDLPGGCWDVTLSGDLAFVANDYYDRVQVMDVGDPRNPALIGEYDAADEIRAIAIAGDHAYMAYDNLGLLVMDVSDPTSPSVAGTYDTPGTAYDLAVSGDYAYVADGYPGYIGVVDVSDPAAPTLVAEYQPDHATALGIVVDGDYAYLANGDFAVVDITRPTSPTAVSVLVTEGSSRDVAVSGDYAYLASSERFDIVDISDPANPSVIGNLAGGWIRHLDVEGDYAFLADSEWRLRVADISDPANPQYVGDPYGGTGDQYGVDYAGDYAFTATGYGLQTFEVFDRHFVENTNSATSLVIDDSGWRVVAVRLATAQEDSIKWEVCADGTNWEKIVRGTDWYALEDPGDSLRWRATLYTDGGNRPACTQLALEYMYESPFVASVSDIPRDQGRQVRVAWDRSGYDFVGSPYPIHEYAVYRQTGLGDWDYVVTVPARAEDRYSAVVETLADSTGLNNPNHSVFFVRAFTETPGVYFDSPPDSGYSVDNIEPPTSYSLYPNAPNPFNPTTTIRYDVPAGGGDVTLVVYDVLGRCVKTLLSGHRPQGQWYVEWDGRDRKGTRVSSGVYFCRLRGAGFEKTIKMLLLE